MAVNENMKKMMSFMAAMLLGFSVSIPVFANETIGGGTPVPNSEVEQMQITNAETHSDTKPESNTGGFDYSAPDDPADIFGIPEVTVEDLNERVNSKGNDIINILQSVGKWICIAGFIISVLFMIFGCFGNTKLLMQGTIGMIIAGVAYSGIMFGREIVMFIASWAAS